MGIWFALIVMCLFVGFGGVMGASVGLLLLELVVKAIAVIPRLGALILRLFGFVAGGAAGAWIALSVTRDAALGPEGAFPMMSSPLLWFSMVAVTVACIWGFAKLRRTYK